MGADVIISGKLLEVNRMEYREIKQTDIESLAEMFAETFNASPWNDGWTQKTAEKRLHGFMVREGFYGISAYDKGQLVGMILGQEELYYEGNVFEIEEFCIRNSMRGKGLGKMLYKEFEHRLKERGTTQISLLTMRQEATLGFYQSIGYEVCHEIIKMDKKLT